jgi:hypothetical protein
LIQDLVIAGGFHGCLPFDFFDYFKAIGVKEAGRFLDGFQLLQAPLAGRRP